MILLHPQHLKWFANNMHNVYNTYSICLYNNYYITIDVYVGVKYSNK